MYDSRDGTSEPALSPCLPKSASLTYLSVYDNRDSASEPALSPPPLSSLTHVHRCIDSPDPLPDTDVVVYPGRVDKFETVILGRGFVRVISESIRTVEQYGGVSIEIGEGLPTCTALDYAETMTSMMWEHLKSGWLGAPEELIRQVKIDCDRNQVLFIINTETSIVHNKQ